MIQENYYDENYNCIEEQQEAEQLDWIIETENYDRKKNYNHAMKRWYYDLQPAKQYEGKILNVDQIECSIRSEQKISKKGKPYHSNNNLVTIYSDTHQIRIRFYNEMFQKYNQEKDQLTVSGNHPIVKIIQAMSKDTTSNKFTIKYSEFVEKLKNLKLQIQIYSYEENNYKKYSFEVLEAYEDKEE